MTFSENLARRKALRYAADALMPGVNDGWDEARRAVREIEFRICDAQDAQNEALANPSMRVEAAAAMLEMRAEHISQFIEEVGIEYAGEACSRIDAAVKRIRAHLVGTL